MLTEKIGSLQGFAPILTDKQKELIAQYPYMNLFSEMLVYIYDKDLQMYRWTINDEYAMDAVLKSMDTYEYRDF